MGLTIAEKIIKAHLLDGTMVKGEEIGIRIDQTLTQDSTGTMAYLQFEAMGIPRVKTKRSVAYVDHNMLQEGYENADDHKYIQTVANKHGIYFSRPGNGICHQVHLERFGVPGETLLGSDSHTPTGGALGMLAIGAGGLDVAVAMGGSAYYLTMPRIVNVKLTGKLRPFVSAKDVILQVLRLLSVKGGVGRIIEYTGDGVATLSVPERATITNMGAELGATTSVFPSDGETKRFLDAQSRGEAWMEITADADAVYDECYEVNLSELTPRAACPHSPDNVKEISELGEITVDQVAIGSCTNSSIQDLMKVAKILKGKKVHDNVSLVISPGSKQVMNMLADNGALSDLIGAGARILESGCGPCIGMGQSPATNAVSLRTFNRNFKGRCGTDSAGVYLVSPEVAAASAVAGRLTDPRSLQLDIKTEMPDAFSINDNMVIAPDADGSQVEVVRGPNIKPFPINTRLTSVLKGKVLIKVGDNITTDHIMPSHAKLLPYRSNIPYLADYCLVPCNPDFPARAKENGGGIILAGENYGQGSSREHAALVPLYLGVKAVIAISFARIHKANLINSGILPLTFVDVGDYQSIGEGDTITIKDADNIKAGKLTVDVEGRAVELEINVTDKELQMLKLGGKINMIKEQQNNG